MGLATALFPTLARLPMLWPSVALAQQVARHPGCQPVSVGYSEPSALFLTQGTVRFVAPNDVPAELAKPGCFLLAIEARSALTLPLEQTGHFSGLNLGNGHKTELTFYLRP